MRRFGRLSVLLLSVLAASCSSKDKSTQVVQAQETTAKVSAAVTGCDPAVENCCPPTGFTEQVLTAGSDTLSTAQPNQCVRALAGDDVLMVGPHGFVIGGPGNDTINAWDHGTVVPGPGADIVSISSGGTVEIFDLCEVQSGENLFGGGDGTLITPVPLSQLQSAGASVSGFGNVVVQQNSCLSSCVTKPNCSGHGVCAEGATPGAVRCQCDLGFSGPDCTRAVPPIAPILECVSPLDATHFEARFGYQNTSTTKAEIPIGPDNQFSPGDRARGQPEDFDPGTMQAAFAVRFDGNPLTWSLAGHSVTASSTSPACPTTNCSPGCAEGQRCVGGACTTDCGDGLCAGEENCRTCAADCACLAGQTCFADTCASPARCGIDWQCGSGTSFGVSVDCGACAGSATCVNHVCR
jgi:hypothetical protein